MRPTLPRKKRNAQRVCFFFQAEDGIRDADVTGVQTCALPISPRRVRRGQGSCCGAGVVLVVAVEPGHIALVASAWRTRSEERRVGKSVDLGGRRIIKKKKKRVK